MGQPFPPQGNQKQHTEKPLKVYAEQYFAGEPLPVGVLTTAPSGETTPYFIAGGVYQPVNETDWILSSRYNGQPIEVISDEEFKERFGGGNLNLQPAEGREENP